jgi:hypothetical protein
MPRDSRTWHHIVLTTYGAWLYGDARGFRTRHHREHIVGDYKNPPPSGMYAEKERRSRALLKTPPVELTGIWQDRVGTALWQEFTRQGAWVLVIAVASQHVHVLVKLNRGQHRQLTGRAKRFATLALKERGWQGHLWGVRSKAVLIRDRRHQVNAFRYIVNHAREGAWVRIWKQEPNGPCAVDEV